MIQSFSTTLTPEQAKRSVIRCRKLAHPGKEKALHRLQAATIDITKHGTIRRLLLPKGTDKFRTVFVANNEDAAANYLVKPGWEAVQQSIGHADDFGVRSGSGREQAIKQLVASLSQQDDENGLMIAADVEECFDRIPRYPLQEHQVGQSQRTQLQSMLGAFDKVAQFRGCGVPQGSPLAPVLANIALSSAVFRPLREEFSGIRVLLYVDDVLLVARKCRTAMRALERLQWWLGRAGMRLAPAKTRPIELKRGAAWSYLGLEFVWKPGDVQIGYSPKSMMQIWDRLKTTSNQLTRTNVMNGWLNSIALVNSRQHIEWALEFVEKATRNLEISSDIRVPEAWDALRRLG